MSYETMERIEVPIPANERLEDVVKPVYKKILDFLDTFKQQEEFTDPKEYEKAKYVIGNHLYLIYERLHLNIVREIDYTEIKNFAVENNEFVKYVFKQKFKNFPIEALDSWTQVHVDILECAMYKNSNQYNKHIFH